MTKILFSSPIWVNIRGVRFQVMEFMTLVPVLVTYAALKRLEPAAKHDADGIDSFAKHRSLLERLARSKYVDRKVGEDGVVVLGAADIPARANA